MVFLYILLAIFHKEYQFIPSSAYVDVSTYKLQLMYNQKL